MATSADSANLILKLYELRREETMRKARDFMLGFDPRSVEDYMAVMMGPNNAYVRQVTSYWEMAAAFVNEGVIDAKLFDESNGEHIVVFGKVEAILPGLRAAFGNPGMLANLEKVCLNAPGGIERVRATAERIRAIMSAGKAAAAGTK
jgi:hypothetical protein